MTARPDTPPLRVRLASPRGFCAGVERAIRAVEDALGRYGAPVYVRHEIVHNRAVVDRLAAMGAVFIETVDEADPSRPLIFSAHGSPRSAYRQAERRGIAPIDATCPLVHKVHAEIRRHVASGRRVYLIGHKGHPEVVGAVGQARKGSVELIETVEAARSVSAHAEPAAYATQTTLSVDDAQDIIAALKSRLPQIKGPRKEDICYATTNRQAAVKATAKGTDLYLVVGSQTSSNSKRLVEVAKRAGARRAALIENDSAIDERALCGVRTLGLSAGASTPEDLVEGMLRKLSAIRPLRIETVDVAREDVVFNSPLRAAG